ncbi:MAG: hypothetical protein IJP88_05475 [Synergistaceae bacterium]|nr:hypothetical protein [Synergistaceae bacterium]
MSEYITHTRFDGKDINGREILIRRGHKLERKGELLYYDERPVCVHRSLVGKQHFAKNDDGLGLERGDLTYAIAYSPRVRHSDDGERQQRFTDAELETLNTKWVEYLKPNVDMLLFNDKFFELSPDVLKEIARDVNI